MRLSKYLSSSAGIMKFPWNSAKYLETVFNISFVHGDEEISGDFLVHSPAKFATADLHKLVQENVFDFIKHHRFNSERDLARATGASNYSLIIPSLTVERYTLLANFVAVHLLVDDFFDGPQISNRPEHVDMLIRMNHMLSNYIRCNALPIDDEISSIFPRFGNICRMYFELGAELQEIGNDLHHVYQGFDLLVGGNIIQAKLGRPKSKEEYLKRKADNFGLSFYFALNGALTGETLTEETRTSAVFKQFQYVTSAMCALASDPMSILFDLLHGIKNDNYSVMLTENGVSVKEAVDTTMVRCNRLFLESLLLISQLDEMNVCESDRRYLRLCLTAIRGTLEFPPNHILYNPNNNLKCKEIVDRERAAKCVLNALHGIENI